MAISRLRKILRDEVERVRKVHNRNVDIFRHQPWREISGSFGDIGTFIPIFIALEGNLSGGEGTISASSTLVFSGLSNLLTGLFFGIPLPVQPMKAIAAVAIANPDAYNQARYASAGLFVAGVVAVLSLSGTHSVVHKISACSNRQGNPGWRWLVPDYVWLLLSPMEATILERPC